MMVGHEKVESGAFEFCVWAPLRERVELVFPDQGGRTLGMRPEGRGYWRVLAEGVGHGDRYGYLLDGEVLRGDPAAHWVADGVHGVSRVVDHGAFGWRDGGFAASVLEEHVVYELHVGAFTESGDFQGAIARLDHLAELGVNAVEVMPVAQFPGVRNWGYDGVYPYAVARGYGGPRGFKEFVDACHGRGLAVVLDVVYNHLGPEGNYLRDFGPYFTDRYKTPWGEAVNYDGPGSDGVRNFVVQNALHWFRRYHVDALRLDAVQMIYDTRPEHILAELSRRVGELGERLGRPLHLIAETDANDPSLPAPLDLGGKGADSAWSDDFHHSLHAWLTGEEMGYYADFGDFDQIVRAVADGFVYTGQYSAYWDRSRGLPGGHLPGKAFLINIQTHDQTGNRMNGERLMSLAGFEACKLAAALLLTSPYLPMLFMGEEWGEERPFLYFTDHGDPELVRAVRRGRIREFAAFRWKGKPPDPQSEETFMASKLDWDKPGRGKHRAMLEFYKALIALRRGPGPLTGCDRERSRVSALREERVLCLTRQGDGGRAACFFNFADERREIRPASLAGEGDWRKVLDSAEERYGGPGSALAGEISGTAEFAPFQAAVYLSGGEG